jgi:hypothetical protein
MSTVAQRPTPTTAYHQVPRLRSSLRPDYYGLIERYASPGERSLLMSLRPGNVVLFGGDTVLVTTHPKPVRIHQDVGRASSRIIMNVKGIVCRGELRDGAGVSWVWFEVDGTVYEASRTQGWLPRPSSMRTHAKGYKADLDARKAVALAARHLNIVKLNIVKL